MLPLTDDNGNEVSDDDFPVNVLLRACCNQEVRLGNHRLLTKVIIQLITIGPDPPVLAGRNRPMHSTKARLWDSGSTTRKLTTVIRLCTVGKLTQCPIIAATQWTSPNAGQLPNWSATRRRSDRHAGRPGALLRQAVLVMPKPATEL